MRLQAVSLSQHHRAEGVFFIATFETLRSTEKRQTEQATPAVPFKDLVSPNTPSFEHLLHTRSLFMRSSSILRVCHSTWICFLQALLRFIGIAFMGTRLFRLLVELMYVVPQVFCSRGTKCTHSSWTATLSTTSYRSGSRGSWMIR